VDETRFDAIAKTLGTQTTRRLTFSAFIGGALGFLGASDASGACDRDCGECHTCKKGRCKTKNGKKKCKKGKCEKRTDGTACSIPTGGTCENGSCRCLNGTTEIDGQCFGRCPLGQQRDPASAVCCIPSGTGPCTLGADPTCCKRFCENSPDPPFSICT
jgi:hypothetical protein